MVLLLQPPETLPLVEQAPLVVLRDHLSLMLSSAGKLCLPIGRDSLHSGSEDCRRTLKKLTETPCPNNLRVKLPTCQLLAPIYFMLLWNFNASELRPSVSSALVFETRQEQERAQEVQAMLEFNLQEERRGRAAAIAEAVEMEKVRNNSDKRLAEMKRELQISKEEARRAWEELGRREQEERDRTMSLRDGRPTLVGGVQVVPMMQGVPSRQGSTRDIPPTREGPFVAQEPAIPEGPIDNSDAAYQEYARNQKADPADPFVETTRSGPASTRPRATDVQSPSTSKPVAYSQAPAVQPASASAFYQQQQGVSLHGVDPAGRAENDPSYGASESGEEEYEMMLKANTLETQVEIGFDTRGLLRMMTRTSTM